MPSVAGIVVRTPSERLIPSKPRDLIAQSTLPREACGVVRRTSTVIFGHPVETFWCHPAHAVMVDLSGEVSSLGGHRSVADRPGCDRGGWCASSLGRSARRSGSPARAGPGRSDSTGVELSRENNRGPAEDLGVVLEPEDRGLEVRDLGEFLARGTLVLSAVDLGLHDPAAHRLLAEVLPTCNGLGRRGQPGVPQASAPAPEARTAA